ncbi:MAG: metallophosphoesterase [Paludibacteraceae bacterium]|nr:metallophosphoesterase [Paludibacteraceae bacterium]
MRWQAWFVNPAEPQWNNDTLSVTFTIPACMTTNGDVLVLGDTHSALSREQWAHLDSMCPNITAYASVGDLLERGNFYYVQKHLHELKGTRFESLPMLACVGNHEYQKGLRRTLPAIWQQTFRMPTNGPLDFQGSTYFVDFPAMRVIAINTTGLQSLRDYTRVYTWLKRTMQTRQQGQFSVVIMHHPVYSVAKGRYNVFINLFFCRLLNRADIVFCGHDHTYARHLPYIELVSVERPHAIKSALAAEKVIENEPIYSLLSAKQDTLVVRSYLMRNDSLVDEVVLTKDSL